MLLNSDGHVFGETDVKTASRILKNVDAIHSGGEWLRGAAPPRRGATFKNCPWDSVERGRETLGGENGCGGGI